MKQLIIHIPNSDYTWNENYLRKIHFNEIIYLVHKHALKLGYWRPDKPDYAVRYVSLWKDGEITMGELNPMQKDWERINWKIFLNIKPKEKITHTITTRQLINALHKQFDTHVNNQEYDLARILTKSIDALHEYMNAKNTDNCKNFVGRKY